MIRNLFRRRRKGPLQIPAWNTYQEQMAQKSWNKKTLLEEIRFVVFDTETTGLDHKNDRILSIGAVMVQAGNIDLSKTFELYLQQNEVTGKESIPIHGILPSRGQEGVPETEALGAFLDYVGDAVLVGQHVGFDLAIVNESLNRHGAGRLRNRHLDTMNLALRVEHVLKTRFYRPEDYSLDALCDRFGIEASDRHTATGDAFITALLLLKFLHRLKQRGVKNLADLFRVL
jgi:DNA polymerase-3 subunit epsilon